ncbi:uroporphyrinogen-III synthase [Roseivivax sp.]
MPDPILLLTRPDRASRGFLEALASDGLRPGAVVISPLIEIVPEGALPDMAGIAGLIFTSAHGVEAYQRAGGPHRPNCFAVGSATAEAARAIGLHPATAEGDAEALIALIQATSPEGPLLHLRGRHARGDIAARLTEGGIETREAVLYDQRRAGLSPEAQAALGGTAPVVAPLFSPRTADLLAASGPFAAPLYVAAMSGAVAERLKGLPRAELVTAAQPNGTAMRKALADLWARAQALEGGGPGQ